MMDNGKLVRLAFLVVLAGVCVGGCGKSPAEKTGKSSGAGPVSKLKTDHQPADRWDGKLEIIVGGLKEYQEFVASHKGKIVVADLWSTWCGPCLKELPKLAALQQVYGDKVVCVAVALDYESLTPNDPEQLKEIRKPIEDAFRKAFGKMLGKDGELHAEFRLFVANEVGEKFTNALGAASQPTILIYDQAGKVTLIDVNSVNKEKNEKAEKEGKKRPDQDEVSYEKHIVPILDKLTK